MQSKQKNLLLFVPNLVGYTRVLLLIACITTEGVPFLSLYIVSAVLDFFDGYTARFFNQSSLFGSCLDMMTDRLSTVLIILKIFSNINTNNVNSININKNIVSEKTIFSGRNFMICMMLLYSLDFISHFLHFSVSLISKKHHKDLSFGLLKIYYDKRFLFSICVLEQLFFCLMYADIYFVNSDYKVINSDYKVINSGYKTVFILMSVYLVKSVFHFVQLMSAIEMFKKEYELLK